MFKSSLVTPLSSTIVSSFIINLKNCVKLKKQINDTYILNNLCYPNKQKICYILFYLNIFIFKFAENINNKPKNKGKIKLSFPPIFIISKPETTNRINVIAE